MVLPRFLRVGLIWESQFSWGEVGGPSKNKKSRRAFKVVKPRGSKSESHSHWGMADVWVSWWGIPVTFKVIVSPRASKEVKSRRWDSCIWGSRASAGKFKLQIQA
jgi:hypothetical protein